ncbi:hypothetical protein VP01_5395g3 [Puccinia sorghi]|uniref:Uncharacterized protein n=1 Tax=Puccinia sorghi TaxID=27349 RepID=A0A0L6UKL4_9BASI|nr:hypothetical protein VP01_5395g3 [Puccinia sorghi]
MVVELVEVTTGVFNAEKDTQFWNQFANISFDISNIEKLVKEVRTSIAKMQDFGMDVLKDIITYNLPKQLPEVWKKSSNQSLTQGMVKISIQIR